VGDEDIRRHNVSFIETLCKSALSKSGIYGIDYSLNPYFGCEHSCIYCYVPRMLPSKLKGRAWGSFVEVKTNIPKILAKELRSISSGRVLISSITDSYQPIEQQYQLTRRCIELLAKKNFEVIVLTKSTLFTRDLDVMNKERFELGVTVTTLNAYKELEPNSPPPLMRLQALKEASENGFKTFIFLGPLIPGIVDDELQEILELAYNSNVKYVIVDKLNTKGDVTQAIAKALNRDQMEKFMKAMSNKSWIYEIKEKIIETCNKLHIPYDFCF